eukprot:jgi/Chrzof1/691/Cz01g25010.t1
MAVNLPHLQLLPSDALHADTGSDMTLARQLMLLQFQTEINDKIPPSVQEACLHEWRTKQCVTVVCANLYGTFYVNSAGEFHIRMHANEEVVSPNKFEELAGKKTARNWQQSIRLADYTMTGEQGSALLKLGHFTRIVGLTLERC